MIQRIESMASKRDACTLTFIAALFTTVKRQKQTKDTPTDE